MWHRSLLSVLAVSVFVMLLSAPAQGAKPTAAEKRKARVLFRKGQTHYRVGEFAEALDKFTSALKLVKRPSIILNIAQCHRQLKSADKALFFYKLYQTEWERTNPNRPSPYHNEVQGHITQLEAELERARSEQRAKEEEERRRREAEEARQAEAERQQRMAAMLKGERTEQTTGGPIYKKWWFWTALGVVVAGATTATVIALQPESASPVDGTLPDGPINVE
jgi:tetratricopeptide (TPR) repeat protein